MKEIETLNGFHVFRGRGITSPAFEMIRNSKLRTELGTGIVASSHTHYTHPSLCVVFVSNPALVTTHISQRSYLASSWKNRLHPMFRGSVWACYQVESGMVTGTTLTFAIKRGVWMCYQKSPFSKSEGVSYCVTAIIIALNFPCLVENHMLSGWSRLMLKHVFPVILHRRASLWTRWSTVCGLNHRLGALSVEYSLKKHV